MPTAMPKWARILTDDLAILLYLFIGWAVPLLKSGSFATLTEQSNLTSLAVLVLVWLGYYAMSYLRTGDLTPPMPAAQVMATLDRLSLAVDALTARVNAALPVVPVTPPVPPAPALEPA